MLPRGRWRGGALSPPTALLALLFLSTATVSAASSVLGLDFGTLNLKAALVKPGIPLEIVLTKESKRKETAAVAFKSTLGADKEIFAEVGTFPERVYGGDALALQGRMPSEVFPNLKHLLGLSWNDEGKEVVEAYKGRYPAVQAQLVRELGTTLFKSNAFASEEMPWSVEELLAMELANVRRNAESLAGSVVEDVVVTVPAFYTADERRAIEKAAQLAGLEVKALISDGLAVGLDYAKSRTFPEATKGEKPEYHIVFDMGAGSTTATILRFQGRSVKDVGRFNKTVQEVAVMGAGWDRTLGGDALNEVVLQDYIYKFLTKPVLKSREKTQEDIRGNGRLMSRMWKEVERARQVLSANTETSSSFEELLPEIDFRTKLSRSEFESLTESFAERVPGPVNDALSASKLELKDIDSIILHGGAVRTPFVQKKLEQVAGSKDKLRSNVNADESAVFGAAFKGAGLSPSFKVKEIRDSDVAFYPAGMTYKDAGKERKQQLFSATSPVGSGSPTKQVTFKNKDDFSFGLYQAVNGAERAIANVQTENLTASVGELKSRFGCVKEEVSTKFSIRLSAVDGLPEVLTGTVSCEAESTAKGGSVGDTVKDWFGFGGKKDQEPLKEGEDDGPVEEVDATTTSSTASGASDSATTSGSSASSSSSRVPEKPKKRTESITIAFTTIPQGNPQPGPEEMKRMRERLAAFDRSDKMRAAREEAMNMLEGYTYYVRDFLGNSDYAEVATDKMRDEISKALESARSFTEDPKAVAKATEETFREQLNGMKKLVEPIQSRRKEGQARPEKVEELRKSLDQTRKFIEMVREQVEGASSASSQASEYEASKSAAGSSETTETASPSLSDEWADPDDEPSSTISKTEAPKYSEPALFSPYTSVDLAELETAYESAEEWLNEKEAEQGKLKPYEDPAFTVSELEKQANKLSSAMTDLIYKNMRQHPKSSSKKSFTKTSKSKTSKKGSGTSSAASETTDAPSQSGTAIGKPKFMTVNAGDDMPSEEEILRMIREAKEGGASPKSSKDVHNEL